jgi:hypothetical protein
MPRTPELTYNKYAKDGIQKVLGMQMTASDLLHGVIFNRSASILDPATPPTAEEHDQLRMLVSDLQTENDEIDALMTLLDLIKQKNRSLSAAIERNSPPVVSDTAAWGEGLD